MNYGLWIYPSTISTGVPVWKGSTFRLTLGSFVLALSDRSNGCVFLFWAIPAVQSPYRKSAWGNFGLSVKSNASKVGSERSWGNVIWVSLISLNWRLNWNVSNRQVALTEPAFRTNYFSPPLLVHRNIFRWRPYFMDVYWLRGFVILLEPSLQQVRYTKTMPEYCLKLQCFAEILALKYSNSNHWGTALSQDQHFCLS